MTQYYDDEDQEPRITVELAAGEPEVEQLPDEDPDGQDDEDPGRGRGRRLQERFNQLTSRLALERAGRAHAERRAQVAEALMRRLHPAARGQLSPEDLDRHVEARVAQRLAAHAFNSRSNAVHAAGVKTFPDFEDRIGRLQEAGVLHPQDPRFLAAVLETDAPHKVLHHLAGDPGAAVRIAALPPVKQAAELAKVAMKVGQQGYRPVSRAPAPISPIGGASARRFDPLDESVPMDEWVREMDKRDQARAARR